MFLSAAKEVWDAINIAFSNIDNDSMSYNMKCKDLEIKQRSQTVMGFFKATNHFGKGWAFIKTLIKRMLRIVHCIRR